MRNTTKNILEEIKKLGEKSFFYSNSQNICVI